MTHDLQKSRENCPIYYSRVIDNRSLNYRFEHNRIRHTNIASGANYTFIGCQENDLRIEKVICIIYCYTYE